MPTTVFPGGIGPGTVATLGGIGDTGILLSGTTIISTVESGFGALDSIGIRAFANNNLVIHGTVHGDQWGIRMGEEVSGGDIFVGDTGDVTGTLVAAIENSPAGDGSPIGDFNLVNRGDIAALGQGAGGVVLRSGPVFDDRGFVDARFSIENAGIISALGDGGNAIHVENTGVQTTIVNDDGAEIMATSGAAIVVGGSALPDPDEIVDFPDRGDAGISNFGLISGGFDAERLQNVAYDSLGFVEERFLNEGEVVGHVFLGAGNDTMWNGGILRGGVDLGGGNDTFDGRGGIVDAVGAIVAGGTGDDTFLIDNEQHNGLDGGDDVDTLWAATNVSNAVNFERIFLTGTGDYGVEADDIGNYVEGNAGDNALNGNGGNDELRGRQGDDDLRGGTGRDLLYGNAGNDVLQGEGGDDTILGGLGDDTILAGNGQDVLRGQQGADVFVFEAGSELGAGAARDYIQDFQRGIDLIDVSEINTSEAFTFNGMAGFTATGPSIYFNVSGGANAIVRFDIDGNGTEDARLQLNGVTVVDATDFVL